MLIMDALVFLHAVLALCFVLGLMFVSVWLVKYCETKGQGSLFFKKMKVSNRLSVEESKRLDARNVMTIIRCDDTEYVLVLNGQQNLLLDTKKVKK